MKKINKKELDYLKSYYPHLYSDEHKIIITDDRMDGRQYCMVLSDDNYVYCYHDYEREEIFSMNISWDELSRDDLKHTVDKHGLKDKIIKDQRFKMLCIEDLFEDNIQ